MWVKFLGSDRFFCFISISTLGSFKNPFATSRSELHFRCKRFILWVQTKEVVSMSYCSSTSSWKPWRLVSLDLIFTMRNIYINPNLIPPLKFISISGSTEFKDILPWNMIVKTIPISTRIVISYTMKRSSPFLSLKKSHWKLRQQGYQNFPMEGKPLQNNCCRQKN